MHGPDNRAAAEAVIAGAQRDGVTVGRVWALGEGDRDAATWLRDHFLFRAGPRGWVDAGPRHLDRVIAAAGRAGIRLIITLSNSWADYGGVPRYLRWVGRWRDGYGATDRFYSDAQAAAAYRAHIERLLARTNEVTGVRYRDDPTILAWELMNESATSTAAGARARLSWITAMAGLIHRLDPNHLVISGVSGYRLERERSEWLAACSLPVVDFCDGHIYPEEMLRNRRPDELGAELDAIIDDFVRLGQTVAGKPFVLGEFGVRGDGSGSWGGRTRATWTEHILTRLRFDGAAGGLVWIYQRAGGADRAHGIDVAPETAPAADAAPPRHAASVEIREAIRRAAAALVAATVHTEDRPRDGHEEDPRGLAAINPDVTRPLSEMGLRPLHREFAGASWSVPLVRPPEDGDSAVTVTWDPTTYARADWETSGVHGGGEVEHAWGGESGWFEYEYQVAEPPAASSWSSTFSTGTSTPGLVRGVVVRARVSSEFPGTSSPPDGTSTFEVSLDGVPLGRATAPRDDGRGGPVTVRARLTSDVPQPLAPGRHRLRFTVPPGPHAHGLAIYGRPGEKTKAPIATAPIELRLERAR
jgi:mannan endo-1,4-beta-mannosidase